MSRERSEHYIFSLGASTAKGHSFGGLLMKRRYCIRVELCEVNKINAKGG